MTTDSTPFEIGKAQIFYETKNPQAVIIATGSLVYNALVVAHDLAKEWIEINVVNLATIKPLDEATIIAQAKLARAVVTVEEHQIRGGMGSAVAECLAKNHPVPMEFVGVDDKFGQSGTPEELIEHYGMGVESIKKAVKKVLERKV
jgi:transketolase